MRGHRGSCIASAVLLVVVLATLGGQADAKKRRKSRKSHKSQRSHSATPASPSGASAGWPAASAGSADAACVATKDQLLKAVEKYQAQDKVVVSKHNKLVTEYNDLLKHHSELIRKFNMLVTELEDPSTGNFLAAKAVKVYHHPGIEGAVNKTYIHILPRAQVALSQGQISSAQWFNSTQSRVQNFLQASIGGEDSQEWLPTISGFIVYGSVVIPVSIACWCVMELVCKLNQLILFGHVYLAVSGILMAGFAATTGEDPLSTFAEQDPHLYQFAQFAFALLFVLYGLLSFLALCADGEHSDCRCANFAVVLIIGFSYYMLIWTPAMMDELPKVDDFFESLWMPELEKSAPAAAAANMGDDVPPALTVAPYLVVATVFSLLFMFESNTSKVTNSDGEEIKDD